VEKIRKGDCRWRKGNLFILQESICLLGGGENRSFLVITLRKKRKKIPERKKRIRAWGRRARSSNITLGKGEISRMKKESKLVGLRKEKKGREVIS